MRYSRGFTLIEVLIAIAIFSFIAVGTSEAIRRGFHVKKRVEEEWNTTHGVRSALSIVQRDIHLAFHKAQDQEAPDFGFDREKWFRDFFIGKAKALHFTSLSHRKLYENVHESELSEVGYFLKPEAGKNLFIRRSSAIVDEERERGGEEDVVLDNVKDVEFRYFSSTRDRWFDEWDTERTDFRDRFPDAVEIKLIVFENEKPVEYVSKILIALPNNKEQLEPQTETAAPQPEKPKEEEKGEDL